MRLAALLCEAAELEHALLCKYLYAAFSLKREPWEDAGWEQLESIRGWTASLLLIARQEMEHLALVCNLLTAIGEAPYLRRPNFPIRPRHYPLGIKCDLEVFGRPALKRFIEFEMPANPNRADRARLRRMHIPFDPRRHTTIGALYETIRSLFAELALPQEALLFTGPKTAQVVTAGPRGLTLDAGPSYQVVLSPVNTAKDAEKIIDRIIAEGEGTKGNEENSHFDRLCDMYDELTEALTADEMFKPARRVVSDSVREMGVATPDEDAVVELDGIARDLVELFDLAYETLILMLIRFFAHTHESPAEASALQDVAFFPMMTAVIRPLGEIVTQLPRAASSDQRAGPRFGFDRALSLLPHERAGDRTIHMRLELLAVTAQRCARSKDLADTRPAHARVEGRPPHDVRPRLRLISENLAAMARHFTAALDDEP